ncbi:hypothetical protein Hanom_Chr10g00933861 [Helianthus anomalus]
MYVRAGHIGSLACPRPGLKLPPKGPRPNPSPPGVVTWAFLSNPRPNPHPIPHSLTSKHFSYRSEIEISVAFFHPQLFQLLLSSNHVLIYHLVEYICFS